MHLPCENTDKPCPVVLPDTCPPPRCDCQEDRSRVRHCRLCHLPFDIEGRLHPHSGLRVFCSCFLGESSVLLRCPMVFWMPVIYIPNPDTSEVDSGRSSLSAGSNHSVTPTADARLNESGDSSRNKSPDATPAECDQSLPKETISDSSAEYDQSLQKDGFVDSSESNHSSPKSRVSDVHYQNPEFVDSSESNHSYPPKSRVSDTSEESDCSLPPQDDDGANKNDRTSLSEEVIQSQDTGSPNTEKDEVNPIEGMITELNHIEVSTADSSSVIGSLDSASSRCEGNRLCKNENLNAPVSSEVNNLKASGDIFYTPFRNTPELFDRALLTQAPRDKEKESTSYANTTEEDCFFSTKLNQNYPTSDPITEEIPRDKLYVNTNYLNLNFSESNTSSLGNGFQLNASAKPFHQSLAPLNTSYSKNNVESKYKFAESYYSSDTWNMSGSNANSFTKNPPPTKPSHYNFAPLNSIEHKRNNANVYNYGKFGIPSNSQVAPERHPLQYPNVETPEQHSSRFEIKSQRPAVNVSSRNEFEANFVQPTRMASVQPNRMTSSHQTRWCAGDSSVRPGFDPRGNLASSNAGVPRHGSGMDFSSSVRNRSGFMEGSDLIQEVIKANAMRDKNPNLWDLVQKFERNSK